MVRIIISFVLLTSLASCFTEPVFKGSPVAGKWELSEVLSDPGNGSGEFMEAPLKRMLTLTIEADYESTGSMCRFNVDEKKTVRGTFNMTADSTLIFDNCEPIQFTFENKNDVLILNYPCAEGCSLKFVRKE